ncbi:MAG: hypothetical protein ACPGJU_11960 [Coraliomargarita sp.]
MNELEDIAESMDWQSQRINEDESDPDFRGIIVNPKGKCEPLCFIFDREGHLRNLADLITNQIEATKYSYYIATKTQFTTVETHVWIIGLLRYLKKHYLSDLEVTDEGDYWETENRETLIEKKNFLQSKIDQLAGAIESAEINGENLSVDDLVAQIEAIAKKLHEER